MKGLIIGIVVGTIVLFGWGSVSWMVLDWHMAASGPARGKLSGEEGVVQAFKGSATETGVYWIPGPPEDSSDEAAMKLAGDRHRAGPRAMVVYNAEGSEPMPPILLVYGVLANLVGVFLAAILLASAAIRNFPGRVLFVTTLGAFVAVVADSTNWIWFSFPDDWVLVSAADHLGGWFLVGIVLAAAIRPVAGHEADPA